MANCSYLIMFLSNNPMIFLSNNPFLVTKILWCWRNVLLCQKSVFFNLNEVVSHAPMCFYLWSLEVQKSTIFTGLKKYSYMPISRDSPFKVWWIENNPNKTMVLDVLECSGLHWAILGCGGLCWTVLGCAGLYWAELGCTWIYWTLLGCARLYLAVLGCGGLHWAVLGFCGR